MPPKLALPPDRPDRPDRAARTARFDSLTAVSWADVLALEPGLAGLAAGP
jgi:hypothetical protein